jgi:hypothetical protein
MPRSSGTYTLPAGNPVVTGTTITSTWANTTFSDVATALTGSVATDGTSPMTGILQMGNNKITGVADGTASSDVATVNQISNPTITGGTIDGAPIGAANPKNGAFLALTANSAAFSGVSTGATVTPSSDNSTKLATTAFVQSAISAISSGVTTFNTRSGNVTLISADVTTALGYTPYNSGGATVITTSNIGTYAPTLTGTGAIGTWGISISGNAATASTATNATNATNASTVTNGVYTVGAQSIAGSKTFTDTMYIGANTLCPIVQTSSGVISLGANLVSNVSYTVPQNDGVANLGFSGLRWAQVYAANGTINTSDANAKQQIADFTAAEIAVGKRLRGLFKTYKMNEAVERKGSAARIHAGVMAQAVFDAFAAEGLDANKYSVYCVDTWIDKNGVSQTTCGIRYDELYAFILGSL